MLQLGITDSRHFLDIKARMQGQIAQSSSSTPVRIPGFTPLCQRRQLMSSILTDIRDAWSEGSSLQIAWKLQHPWQPVEQASTYRLFQRFSCQHHSYRAAVAASTLSLRLLRPLDPALPLMAPDHDPLLRGLRSRCLWTRVRPHMTLGCFHYVSSSLEHAWAHHPASLFPH